MSDLAGFLTARYDEEWAVSLDTGPRHRDDDDLYVQDDDCYYPIVIGGARLRADLEAKRALLELHNYKHQCPYDGRHREWDDDYPCRTLRLLASVYRDHPNFQPEWEGHAGMVQTGMGDWIPPTEPTS